MSQELSTTPPLPTAASLRDMARAVWLRGIEGHSAVRFALLVSLVWLLFYNTAFWQQTVAAMWQPTWQGTAFIASLALVMLLLQGTLLMLMPTRAALRIAAAVLFVVASLSAWFCDTYGVVMNKDMLRNVMQTDSAEALALLNADLLVHVLFKGVLPAMLVLRVRLPAMRPWQALRQRALFVGTALVVSFCCILLLSSSYAVFLREHKPIRFTMIPSAPVTSLASLLAGQRARGTDNPMIDVTGNVQSVGAVRRRPMVLFLVVGETARAANFELGGYARATNQALVGTTNLVYFSNATSCGTATAISVPCMFSHLPRQEFDVGQADRYTNLLDALVKGGFEVEWRDNNAGCKGVCERVSTVNYHDDQYARECDDNECFDEVMLQDLRARLASIERDTVIVFHQMGSHGPAYASRYPRSFETFSPACHSSQLQHCSAQEVRNAYDNTIAYTSMVLRRQIDLLNSATDNVDTALLYVSDHGESLGENGMYLHGLPYAFAPREQKEIPMLFWASSAYAERTQLGMGCLKARAAIATSHDSFYHTVLGAAELRNDYYRPGLDMLASCRHGAENGGHE